jgi:hypothetical protein
LSPVFNLSISFFLKSTLIGGWQIEGNGRAVNDRVVVTIFVDALSVS